MLQRLLEHRRGVSLVAAAATAFVVRMWVPWQADDPVMVLVATLAPGLHEALFAAYLTLLVTTPYLAWSLVLSTLYILARQPLPAVRPALPRYPDPATRQTLYLVIGELHHPTQPIPVALPGWLTISERGLFTGLAIVGAVGSGKTSGCMYPFAHQILGYRPGDPDRRVGGLILEVKGDFCHHVRSILAAHGREADYLEVGLDGPWRYNPLHNNLDAYALAYGIASLLNNVFGKGKEPFWQQAYTNLIKFIILLHKVVDDYVTLFDVYACAINPERLARKIEEGDRLFALEEVIVIEEEIYLANAALASFPFVPDEASRCVEAPATQELRAFMAARRLRFHERRRARREDDDRRDQFQAVKRWFDDDWRRIEPKLRTSIVEGISVFLSLFDDSPALKRVFCPPKACYDPVANADRSLGVPVPPFADLIEQGRVLALNFPVAVNPGLAKTIGTLMKQDFQRAVLARLPAMARGGQRDWREVLFLCDEYHAFATVGESDPTGDEKFFSLSRQAKCIPIVATQSISSLRSALPGESWRTLLQTFRTKIFLSLSDDFSARVASDLCGKDEQLKPQYHLAESGQDARVSVLTGRATAHRATISAAKTYAVHRDYIFEPKAFSALGNAQAIVLAYDGHNPIPPTYCYLKPYYLDPNTTYFTQLARGEV
jgi:hypothetical protein